ncbi:redoxin domain-containing protein [Pedobacter sp. Du54]|uniref:TlpA family protein disulfide reductase n=1 Tax=Pedobacter anseongensis TaxID=3133439 RepID=UPI0030B00215
MKTVQQFARTTFTLMHFGNSALLFLFLFINQFAFGQNTSAIDVVKTGIQIGQQVPDVVLNNLNNYTDASGKLSTTAKLSDFRGKLVILDFWATWCAPCVAMIPRMDSLQKKFKGKVQFLSVTYQTEEEVLPFMVKVEKQLNKHFNIPYLTKSKKLHSLFPHVTLPHYVWIDERGMVKAITELTEITASKIELALGQVYSSTQKQDKQIEFDKTKPLLINGNGGNGEKIVYHSILSGFIDGLKPGYTVSKPVAGESAKITLRNLPLTDFYDLAYGVGKEMFNSNKRLLLVKDTTKFSNKARGSVYLNWLKSGNGYSYELLTSEKFTPNRYQIMQEDLKRLFPEYECSVENQMRKCLVLVRTSTKDKIKSAGGTSSFSASAWGLRMENYGLPRLVAELNLFYLANSPYPVVNGTDYKALVDMSFDTNMTSLTELNDALARYDLTLELKLMPINMLVIRDAVN